MISRRFVFLAAVLLFASGMSIGRAQDTSATSSGSQSDSLGDAARKARAQKKDSSKPAKVFTNDDMGGLRGTISVVGNEPAQASGADKSAEKTEDKKPANGADVKDAKKDEVKDESYWRTKLAAARKVLADDMKEVDILQRELNLKQEQYSQDPNFAMHEQNSRADINKARSEIDAKKQDLVKDKEALSELEDELRKSGGDPGWANESAGAGSSDSSSSGSGTGTSGSGSSNSGAPAPL
jgi:chromosome segregation ATPase